MDPVVIECGVKKAGDIQKTLLLKLFQVWAWIDREPGERARVQKEMRKIIENSCLDTCTHGVQCIIFTAQTGQVAPEKLVKMKPYDEFQEMDIFDPCDPYSQYEGLEYMQELYGEAEINLD